MTFSPKTQALEGRWDKFSKWTMIHTGIARIEFRWIHMARPKILMKNWPDGFVRILNDLVYIHKIVYVGGKWDSQRGFVFISGLEYIFSRINLLPMGTALQFDFKTLYIFNLYFYVICKMFFRSIKYSLLTKILSTILWIKNNIFFPSLQMIQAIQVLRFHLLELEKVNLFWYICLCVKIQILSCNTQGHIWPHAHIKTILITAKILNR